MTSNAVIYTRVSSEKQVEGYSLESQEELCREFAAQRAYTVVDVISDVITGERLERPGLNRLFDLVSVADVRHVIVLNLERLTRGGPAHYAMIAAQLETQGAALEIVTGGYDSSSPEGMLAAQIQSTIAWYDNQMRRERTLRGRVQSARNGNVLVSARPPYGYTVQDGALVIDAAEAAVAQRIFAWAGEGVSAREITRRLCAEQIPTRADGYHPMRKKYDAGVWSKSTVGKILRNPTYIGVWAYGKTKTVRTQGKVRLRPQPVENHIPVAVPALVDAALFVLVQAQLSGRRLAGGSSAPPDALLQGRVFCACGRVCALDWRRSYWTYRCQSRSGAHWEEPCTSKTYERTALVDAAVWQTISAQLLDPGRLTAALAAWRSLQEPATADDRNMLQAALDAQRAVGRKLTVLLDRMLEEGDAAAGMAEDRQALMREHSRLEAEIAARRRYLASMLLGDEQENALLAVAERLRRGLAATDPAIQRRVLDLLQVRVQIVAKQRAHIEVLLPFDVDTVTWARPAPVRRREASDAAKGAESRNENENGIATIVLEHYGRRHTPPPAPAWHVPALSRRGNPPGRSLPGHRRIAACARGGRWPDARTGGRRCRPASARGRRRRLRPGPLRPRHWRARRGGGSPACAPRRPWATRR